MSSSLLCETVTGDTMAELMAARDVATDPDMLELRLDGVRDLDVAMALRDCRLPVIVTCRPQWEGGRFDGDEETRLRVLRKALELGAEYVDVEWRSLGAAGGSGGFDGLLQLDRRRIVVSSHDFSGVPGDLSERVRSMRGAGAAVIKVAVMPRRLSDTLVLRNVGEDGDSVVIGMGDVGVPTRLLATRFGSRWTYAGRGVAPGQMPVARMLEGFRFRVVCARTALYGVVGEDAMQSSACVMHNAAFAAAGIDAVCVPLCVADLEDFATFADALGIAGASVTSRLALDDLMAPAGSGDRSTRPGNANTARRVADGWEVTNIEASVEPPLTPTGLPKQDMVSRLVAEAERQFEWWTGRPPGAGVMRAAADADTAQEHLERTH